MLNKSTAVKSAGLQIFAGTVRNIAGQFLIERSSRGLSRSTIIFYERYLGYFCTWLDEIGVVSIDELDADLIRKYLLYLKEKGHNAGGIHGFYRCIRAMLGWWESESDGEYYSPMARVKPPKLVIQPLPGIKIDDVTKMADSCNNRAGVRDQAIILGLVDTGGRRGEILSLNYRDVDLVTGEVRILRAKGDKFRSVFLGDRSRKALKKYLKTREDLRPESPLFANQEGQRLTPDALKSLVRRRAAAAGVKAPGIHDFRRCFALTMKRNGADVVTISRMMGHPNLEVTKRYLAQDFSDFKKAHEKFGPVDNADQGQ